MRRKTNKLIGLIYLFLLLIAGGPRSIAQPENSSIFIEFGGHAGLWSINYDASVFEFNRNAHLQTRIGLGLFSEFKNDQYADVFCPITISALLGNDEHFVEVGLGQTISNYSHRDWKNETGFGRTTEILTNLNLAYRFQSLQSRFLLRLAYTPFIILDSQKPFQHWFGLSMGLQLSN
jgi:hypothetical protein